MAPALCRVDSTDVGILGMVEHDLGFLVKGSLRFNLSPSMKSLLKRNVAAFAAWFREADCLVYLILFLLYLDYYIICRRKGGRNIKKRSKLWLNWRKNKAEEAEAHNKRKLETLRLKSN
ncbi:unnamed protein product [Brassica rapa]|uniref:Uncharacterized protein n=2 Tax=Brassica TaxID=3705 RepID=A0A8D9GBR1_BRACM|nr:unnamed protein product [Brassica napus]CAG7876493.1 unnamed protein product [Brassica rapa]